MSQRTEHRDATPSRSWHLLRPFSFRLGMVVVLLFLLTFSDMAQPYFLKLLIDDVFGAGNATGGNWQLLWFILPGMGLIYVTRNTLFFSSRMMSLRVSEDLCFDLRKRLFEHLQQQSLRFYKANQPGKVSSRVMDDTFKIQNFIQDKLPTFARYVLEFQVLLVIVYMVNWRLALASTLVLPLHLLTYRGFRRPIRESHSEAQESLAIAHGNIVEKFLGMEVVKGFSAEERESDSFREAIDASRKSEIRTHRYGFAQKVVADLLVGLGTVILLGYGAFEVGNGRMQAGEFLMFFWYVKMLYPAVLEVISGAGHLSKAGANADRVFNLLEEQPADRSGVAAKAVPIKDLIGQLEFRNVSFAYEEEGRAVLDSVNLSLKRGEHVAITGPSGSGKSTLISLPMRFNEPTQGQVVINNIPAETISVQALRKLFGIVFQDVFLFNTTVVENLRYARPDATLPEIIDACKVTGAHEFIQRLPKGYQTRIGEEGSEISRGEKQRITLARALLRNPQVLVLDEATASIDSPAAHEIIDSILERMEGRTVIMVTHDIELLDLVDRVVSLESGKVVFDGEPANFPVPEIPAARRSSPHRRSPMDLTPDAPEGGSPRRPHRPRPFNGGGGAILALLLAVFLIGCVRDVEKSESVSMEEPRLSSGILIDPVDPQDLQRIGAALDEIALNPNDIDPARVEALALGYQETPAEDAPAIAAPTPEEVAANTKAAIADVGAQLGEHGLPADAVKLLPLPQLSRTELTDLLGVLTLRLNAEHGYVDSRQRLADALPALAKNVVDLEILAAEREGGTDVLRLGYMSFLTQPAQLWALGVSLNADGTVVRNAHLDQIEAMSNEAIQAMQQMRTGLRPRDLETRLVQLSYVNTPTAMSMLRGMGITTFDQPTQIPAQVSFDQLPYVVAIPDPDAGDVGLVGQGSNLGKFGQTSIPSAAAALSQNALASPMMQIMVLFHPARPDQYSFVQDMLDRFIDRPARQIFVEGMVLEISESGLEDLGIEWELNEPPIYWTFGNREAGSGNDTLQFESTDLDLGTVFGNLEWNWSVKLRALITEGKAEILSRPSVLTLNNRQSSIRVGEDIPIATSQDATTYGAAAKLSFNFSYLATGIMLNIRPRINEDGSEVSMLIDTHVSAKVPNADLELRSVTGAILASAPTVSTRRVQTYARIKNNTPLIIGGLVSKEHITLTDKVPLLGDLPLIGGLFRSQRAEDLKREVIIVLTPYVLPEDRLIPRSLPKDEDYFDSFGHKLFRDAYRIRASDVFDLNFMYENQRFQTYGALARDAIRSNFRLAAVQPFESFADERLPGEEILVTRMIYEVIKRLELIDSVTLDNAIFFEGQQGVGGYDVRFLEHTMAQLCGSYEPARFFDYIKGKALALTFYTSAEDPNGVASEPIPEVYLIDCPDTDTWGTLLWDLNQPATDGRQRYTILLHDESDLTRLRRALALKHIVTLNGGGQRLRLRDFSVGKVLLIPELKGDQIHVMDMDVARFFFHTEHYYAATIQEIQTRLHELDEALRNGMPEP